MTSNQVKKCICYDRSFEEIKEYAEKHDISSIAELRDRNYCSNGCRLCGPYIKKMLETGQVEFTAGETYRSK